jgi:hypothetical protein
VRVRWQLISLLVATLLAPPGVRAQDAEEDEPLPTTEGRFIVQTAYTELIDGVYHLNADIDYSLSEAALRALESSLPLTIVIEVELVKHRNWMWDPAVATLRYPYQIQWHPLSRRYLVRDIATGEVDSFANYRAAVAALGQVSDLQVISETLLDTDASYRVRMRAVLDLSEYSAPLRVYASFWSSWTIESDWYEWVLR